MKAPEMDWNYLRGALRWLAAAAACGSLLAGLGGYYLRAEKLDYERLGAERDALRGDYLSAESQGRLMAAYYQRYQALRHTGVVGAERRLDWVEAVQDSARILRLPKIQYQIMPREQYAPASLPSFPGLQVYASRMRLEMELMHEGDLAAVFDRLMRTAPGAMHVQSCSIRRLQDAPDHEVLAPNLAAVCELLWFTIQPDAPAQNGAS